MVGPKRPQSIDINQQMPRESRCLLLKMDTRVRDEKPTR